MSRTKSFSRLEADQNGSRRRQANHVFFKSGSNSRPKNKNKTKKRRRDNKSPEEN